MVLVTESADMAVVPQGNTGGSEGNRILSDAATHQRDSVGARHSTPELFGEDHRSTLESSGLRTVAEQDGFQSNQSMSNPNNASESSSSARADEPPRSGLPVSSSTRTPETFPVRSPTLPLSSPSIPQPKTRLYKAIQKIQKDLVVMRVLSMWPKSPPQCLCTTCDNLDINYGSFVIGGQSRKGPWQGKRTMGTLRQILERSIGCPLCRLIVRSLGEQRNTSIARILANMQSGTRVWEADTTIKELDVTCEALWLVDGRETRKDEDGNPVEVLRTRRLCIQWPKSNYAEAHLVLVFPDVNWGPRSLFLGRILTSNEDPKINQIKQWYDLCCESHGPDCSIDHTNEQFEDMRKESYFGVVDLEEMRLTPLPPNSKYAALSYTWGHNQNGRKYFRATLDNVEDLKAHQGFKDYYDQLPRTIQDTFELVRQLGIRYLWVDALCILQDDDELWALNVTRMDAVYGNASITICAADGKDSNSGLKALHQLPSKYDYHATQYVERIKSDLQLMVSYPSETYISRSTWNERAWTFQERVLSKRCLIFTEGRIYFQCRSTTMSEDIYAEEAQDGWSIELLHGPLLRYKKIKSDPVGVYKYTVELYTSRKLSREEDILAAFSGIGKEVCLSLGGEPVFGLPNGHFDFALLWKPDNAPIRRTWDDGRLSLKFPSWAWCGWRDSRMTYSRSFVQGSEINVHEWLMNHTWIVWYIRDGQGNLRLVWDSKIHNNSEEQMMGDVRGYHCSDEALSRSQDVDKEGHPLFDKYGRKIQCSLRKYPRDTFYKTMLKYPFQVRMVEPGQRTTRPAEPRLEDQRFLQFWTWSAYFLLVPENENEPFAKKNKTNSNLTRFGIQDGDGNLVGAMTLGGEWADPALWETPQEFIAISDARGFSKDEMEHWTMVEPSLPGQTEWYAYNVLMLGYDDVIKGVARRAGLGKIYKRAFDSAWPPPGQTKKKMWKEIILG